MYQKILIIGSGGREHAIGWKISQSPRAGKLYFAPGNAGTEKLGVNIPILANEVDKLLEFAKNESIGITLALTDDTLALGIVDKFNTAGLRIFGPTQSATQIESSKAFAKRFMESHLIPSGGFETFTDLDAAKQYTQTLALPIVIKASGLALGKGVFICHTYKEADSAIREIMVKKAFGQAGEEIVIEEYLEGPEISIHAFSDGYTYSLFPTAQDHKRIGEKDTGPNTGGMGTIAPIPFVSKKVFQNIEDNIVVPALNGMIEDGNSFNGVLYPGIMLTEQGPKVLEFNARFGDPEAQTYMRLLDTDLLDIIDACIDGRLNEIEIKWKSQSACTIVLASLGYPGPYKKGKNITGIDLAEQSPDIVVFHAGTLFKDGFMVTNGGRVLGVSAVGDSIQEALAKAYHAITFIDFDGIYYRKDIGRKTLGLSNQSYHLH